MQQVMRLLLTVLGTLWLVAVVAVWVMFPLWIGWDTSAGDGAGTAYWAAGWLGVAALCAAPFIIYSAQGENFMEGW